MVLVRGTTTMETTIKFTILECMPRIITLVTSNIKSYQVSSGVLTTIAVYDFGCASNCSGHGDCDDGVCDCWDTYVGTYCSCGGDSPCNGRGSCLEGFFV